MLRHCAKCEMTTAHLPDGRCQRCAFRAATIAKFRKARPMSEATKARLKALNDWRRGKRATDPRLEG